MLLGQPLVLARLFRVGLGSGAVRIGLRRDPFGPRGLRICLEAVIGSVRRQPLTLLAPLRLSAAKPENDQRDHDQRDDRNENDHYSRHAPTLTRG